MHKQKDTLQNSCWFTWLRVDVGNIVAEEHLIGKIWAEQGGRVWRPVFKLLIPTIAKRPTAA